MNKGHGSEQDGGDFSAAVPLDISAEVGTKADDLLRKFAEDAGLETALIVDRSGALVAGISAEADVTIEVISALVAGASGAMKALVAHLGETGAVESLHLGGQRLIYLREIVNHFILVGVSHGERPAGLVRRKAQEIDGELTELLQDVKPGRFPETEVAPISAVKSLRELARERAELRRAPVEETVDPTEEEMVLEDFPEVASEPVFELEPEVEPEPEPEPEPREILEPLEIGETEFVIEETFSGGLQRRAVMEAPVDSPFEAIDREEMEDEIDDPEVEIPYSESVFEVEDPFEVVEEEDEEESDEDDFFSPIPPEESLPTERNLWEGAPPVEVESGEKADAFEFELGDSPFPSDDVGEGLLNVFEFDEEDDEENDEVEDDFDQDELEPAGETDPDEKELENFTEEIDDMIAAEEEESDVRSSGPFYF